jgi:hypothetical protein
MQADKSDFVDAGSGPASVVLADRGGLQFRIATAPAAGE